MSFPFLSPGVCELNAMQCSVEATERNRWYSVLKVNSEGLETFVLTSSLISDSVLGWFYVLECVSSAFGSKCSPV